MKRSVFVIAVFAASAVALVAQNNQPGAYQGVSNPPPDDSIVTQTDAPPVQEQKPLAGHPMDAPPAAPARVDMQPAAPAMPAVQSASAYAMAQPGDGTDDGIVQIAPATPGQPSLAERSAANDPDGDIVHPRPLRPGELGEGTMIRARLLDRLSSTESRSGEKFRTRVASDVVQGGQVIIPAGAEIECTVASVSSGSFAGHGSMHLRPEVVIMADGSRFNLYAEVTSAPGSGARVGSEGAINPGSQLKKDGIEYGGAVGAGLITGAIVGGPGGALAGTIIGAGVITAHLLISHPQATLDTGTVLEFTLNQPLNLVPAASSGN